MEEYHVTKRVKNKVMMELEVGLDRALFVGPTPILSALLKYWDVGVSYVSSQILKVCLSLLKFNITSL